MAIWNAFILREKKLPNIDNYNFRMNLVERILEKFHVTTPRSAKRQKLQSDCPLRLTGRHFPDLVPSKKMHRENVLLVQKRKFVVKLAINAMNVMLISTDIRRVSESDNSVADALSIINALYLPTIDLQHLASSKTNDEEFKTLISSNDCSIKLKPLKMGQALEVFCDVHREKVRSYVPEKLRFEVFCFLHNLFHAGIPTTKRLIRNHFIWPFMLKDITKWT
ncbi:uncharacterized protein NPIL_416721 [Nephila pilipes]|uniref:Integrase zinc-binding domain-containing protein n=1 Tax=Nephila pilipes TaxID=299642 RepID=A0A8X6NZ70_NEPPI|nr:uncharacterized protein NPIL_416721 [Nephila pilipes]